MDNGGFYCKTCGEYHPEFTMEFDYWAPDAYNLVPGWKRRFTCKLANNGCVINKELYFVRGRLEIPVDELQDPVVFNLWVSVSEEHYKRVMTNQGKIGSENIPPIPGRIANRPPLYSPTHHLAVKVYLQPGKDLPAIVVDQTQHALANHQRNGMSLKDCQRIVEANIHREDAK